MLTIAPGCPQTTETRACGLDDVSSQHPLKGALTMSLLSVEAAAEQLGTTPRFVRRLVAERRIRFVKLGRHVRIDTTDLDAYVAAGRVEPKIQEGSNHRAAEAEPGAVA